MGLVWASTLARKTVKPVLYLTPLAVASQTVREAHKFDINAGQSRDGSSAGHIVVTNFSGCTTSLRPTLAAWCATSPAS